MTRRQQLILFVLGLATVSTCTVGFAMAMNLVRERAVSASAAELPPTARPVTVEGLAWNLPPTPVSRAQIPPTPTPPPTPTNTRVPTWTPSPTRTPTATRAPTDTPIPSPTNTSPASVSAPLAAPATPKPTPTPEFPFSATLSVFDTGTPRMTRVTGQVWTSRASNEGVAGYQMRLVDPYGSAHLSDVSGPGGTASTCSDCGDNRRMNMKVEIPGYTPGTYHVTLVQGGKQVSPEVTFTLATGPLQYVHVDFIPWQ